jgi:lipopolysaccharide/colanic/teichoic acid biosynthesis glycosyltransferase
MTESRPNCERAYARRVKPVADRVLGTVSVIVLSPVLAAVAGVVRVSLGPPVLYRQTRVGLDGKPFTVLKFRSMTADRRIALKPFQGIERRVSFEATDDARHTPLGSFLRRWSLDELPQLWNVARGDMSLVGPRPEVPPAVATYPDHAVERHLVRPGLTGLWQVTARGVMPMEKAVAIDIEYVRRISFRLDAGIVLKTLPVVVRSARAPQPMPQADGAPGSTRGFLNRDPEAYSGVQWLVRLVMRNAQWARAGGVRRLAEEHDLRPIRRTVNAAGKARWRGSHKVPAGEAVAVFMAGVPRSGTNMMVRGLAALPEFEIHNEGDRSAFRRYRLRPDPVIRELIVHSKHAFVLFKPLLDSHRVPGLLDELDVSAPPKALWAYRDVDGRVRSTLSKFGPAASNALRAIASGSGEGSWQAEGLSGDSLELIRSIDWEHAQPADGAALLWYVKNRLFFEMGLDKRTDVLPISYDDLVGNPTATMRGVCGFLGANWDIRASSHIDSRSAGRREPVLIDPRIRAWCDDLAEQFDAAKALVHP